MPDGFKIEIYSITFWNFFEIFNNVESFYLSLMHLFLKDKYLQIYQLHVLCCLMRIIIKMM
jgi:hypothetical protein